MFTKDTKILFFAIVLGLAHFSFLHYCWGLKPIFSPLLKFSPFFNWISTFETGLLNRKVIFYFFDFTIHILLSLPFAYIIKILRPKSKGIFLLLAILPSFFWVNTIYITNPIAAMDLVPWSVTLSTFIYGFLPIPLALLIIEKLSRYKNHNDKQDA